MQGKVGETNLEQGFWSGLKVFLNEGLKAAPSGTSQRDKVLMVEDPVIFMLVQGFVRPNPLEHTVMVFLRCGI
jgi:hypothetical protein